jgi:hypothetical protein
LLDLTSLPKELNAELLLTKLQENNLELKLDESGNLQWNACKFILCQEAIGTDVDTGDTLYKEILVEPGYDIRSESRLDSKNNKFHKKKFRIYEVSTGRTVFHPSRDVRSTGYGNSRIPVPNARSAAS